MSKTSKGMCEAQARKKKRKQAARAKRAYRKAFARELLMEAYGRTFDATRVPTVRPMLDDEGTRLAQDMTALGLLGILNRAATAPTGGGKGDRP